MHALTDHLGSTAVTINASAQKVADIRYDPWGKTRYSGSGGYTPTDRRYTGQIFDDRTSLYFYNARYYDPLLARFTQADTLVPDPANPQSFNRYAYTLNNPLKYTDPTGHDIMLVDGIWTDANWDNPDVWMEWIMAYKGWTNTEWTKFSTEWRNTKGNSAGRTNLMKKHGVHIFNWNTCNCKTYGMQNSQAASINWALGELERQLNGMVDITLVGYSKGGNLVLNYLQKMPGASNVKNAVIIDAPKFGWTEAGRAAINFSNSMRTYPSINGSTSVVNIYNLYDPANDFSAGWLLGATNHLDTVLYEPPLYMHSRKGRWAEYVFTVDLQIMGDKNARRR